MRRSNIADAPRPGAADRVLVVASELPPGPGGIGAHAYAVATELGRQGRNVTLLGSQHYTDAPARRAFNSTAEIPISSFSDGPDPIRTATRRLRQLLEVIRRDRPDLLLASGGRVQWLAAVASRRTGVPVVAVVHGTELGGPAWQRRLARAALDRASRVIAVSAFTKGLVADLGMTRSVDVVPNGADADRFRPDPARRARFRKRHRLDEQSVVLTVGNVTQRKGQHLVVEALPALLRRVPDAVYVTVGRPSEAGSLVERARALGVADHLLVLGQVEADEVIDAHCAADVFAMTSTNTGSGDVEGFGIAILEAALSGVPAVVTSGTGAQEAVIDGRTGLVVPPSTAGIADSLASLLSDPDRRAAMAREAEVSARLTATWRHRAMRYGAILDEVVGGRRPRIVVVSHTEHYRAEDGTILGFGATTRELDHLAVLASELVHVAPLHAGPPPGMALPARAANVRYVPVRPAGGDRPVDRLSALRAVPEWAATINREVRRAEVVHVRCPAGISMVALAVLLVRRTPRDRWVKYAGNWAPGERDALTYRMQRAWLRRGLARAAVSVNGKWPGQPPWVHAFDNPTLTTTELAAGRTAAVAKGAGPPFRVVFAGRVESPKGADIAVDTVLELRAKGLDVTLDVIGDGPLRPWIESRIVSAPRDVIRFHGWLRRDELEQYLAAGHVFLLPTAASEGFPKVLAEAMAFGCVPLTSAVSSLGQTLRETGGAVVLEPGGSWSEALERLLTGGTWSELSESGVNSSSRFGFDAYLDRVRLMATRDWGRSLER